MLSVHVAAELPLSRAARRRDDALVAVLGLGVRLLHARYLARTPFFAGPVIDAFSYRSEAAQLAASGDFGGAFYQPPLYPTFLALLFRLGLTSPWAIALAQAWLGALTCVLLAESARRLSPEGSARRAGLACGVASALYGPFVLYDLELLPPCCVDLLLALALTLSLSRVKSALGDAALGLACGLGVVGWPPLAAFFPALAALRLEAREPGRRRRLGVILLCAALPLGLTARHNATHGGQGVVVSYNLGINLWLGNSPHWRDSWRARPGALFEPELERPDREGVTAPAARSAYFARAAVSAALRSPAAALARTGEKLYYAWHGREIRRDNDIQLLREASPLLGGLLWEQGVRFPFGVVAPLALSGLWRRRREHRARWVGLGALAYSLLLAVFFVSARYRLLLALWLLPPAIDQALFWWRRPRPEWRSLALAALLGLLLNLPNSFTRSFDAGPAERGLLRAHALRNQGAFAAADRLSAELVQRFEGDANVQMLRAEQLVSAGDCAAAEQHLRRTLALSPRTSAPRLLLADCLERLGRPGAAELAYANLLALHPYHPLALKRVAALYLRQHKPREAQALLARFVGSGYRDPEVDGWLTRLDPGGG